MRISSAAPAALVEPDRLDEPLTAVLDNILMDTSSSRSTKPWTTLSLPAALTGIKSMLSHEEKQYLTWLTSEVFEGWGAVIDLGPWLGSSSAALAEGLKRRGASIKVHSMDLFRWESSYMEAVSAEDLNEGDDFLPLFLREVGGYAAQINVQKQDLRKYRWDAGPVEILFVDAAKTWELANAILAGFGHRLVPGKSRVVLQDFAYHDTYWLPLIFDSRPDLWKEVESVDDGFTVTFMPMKPLGGPGGLQADYSEETFTLEAAEILLRSRIENAEPSRRHLFTRSLYRKCLIDGSPEKTLELRAQVVAEGVSPALLKSIEDVESVLVPRGWSAYSRGDYEGSRALAERCLSVTGPRSIYALALLGFSHKHLGEHERARRCMEEILSRQPDFSSANLFFAELAISEGRYEEAEAQALGVFERSLGDETTIDWSLNMLRQAWDVQQKTEAGAETLAKFAVTFGASPSYLKHLAQQRHKVGRNGEGAGNISNAVESSPGHALATEASVETETDRGWPVPDGGSAGRLNRPLIHARSSKLQQLSLQDLTSEVMARVADGSFSSNEEPILLGSAIHEALGRSLDVHNNRFSRRRYRDSFGAFYEYVKPPRPTLSGAAIVELGCGPLNPYGLLFLFLMLGARRGIAIDLDDIHDLPTAIRALADLAAGVLLAPGDYVGDYPIQREQVLANLASFDLAKLRAGDPTGLNGDRLSYRQESVHALSMDDGEADLIFSNAFFEHIPRVEDAITELARVTRKGGLGIHVIDGSDHRRYNNADCHPLEFLTESRREEMVHGSNRLRPLQFADLFERHGFEVLSAESFQRAEVGAELRGRMSEPFRSMSEERLAVTIAKIVVRRK